MELVEIIDRVKGLIGPFLEENGIELIDITFRREQSGMTLKLLVDAPGGIHLDQCEYVNKVLSEMLDEDDIIDGHYVVEVSSPGLDRPIKTGRDFERAMGKALEVTTFGPVDGRKRHEGRLVKYDTKEIVLDADGVNNAIPCGKIALAKLRVEF